MASGKIQLGVALGGNANVAEPPAVAVPDEPPLPLGPLPELLLEPPPELHALTASTAANPNAARVTDVERDADLNRFLIFLQGSDTRPDLLMLCVSLV